MIWALKYCPLKDTAFNVLSQSQICQSLGCILMNRIYVKVVNPWCFSALLEMKKSCESLFRNWQTPTQSLSNASAAAATPSWTSHRIPALLCTSTVSWCARAMPNQIAKRVRVRVVASLWMRERSRRAWEGALWGSEKDNSSLLCHHATRDVRKERLILQGSTFKPIVALRQDSFYFCLFHPHGGWGPEVSWPPLTSFFFNCQLWCKKRTAALSLWTGFCVRRRCRAASTERGKRRGRERQRKL